jgi:hypothetical protein
MEPRFKIRRNQWKSVAQTLLRPEVLLAHLLYVTDFVNIGVADAIRSSLGPKGMDKMIQTGTTTIITNDGATILKHMAVLHPAARMVYFSRIPAADR